MLMLQFFMEKERYVCQCQQIIEIIPQISLKETLSKNVEGLINYGGRLTPVIDFTKLCTKKRAPCYFSTRIIIFQRHEQLLGLLAERVTDIIDQDLFKFTPSILEKSFVAGIAQDEEGVVYQLQIDSLFDLV